ncbi:MAG: peptide chain release factor N(5)-glutamine methyltransferase [Planctomycetes bacterium]|nr:peptide chain release factor N(5)-glutamine methyltransferase [Planctomycetota bacterium]
MNDAPPTSREWLWAARARLEIAGLSVTAEREARLLLEHASGASFLSWWAHPERRLESAALLRAEALLARRVQREPLAYVLGEASFFGRSFHVEPGVLVPREDSAALIELALELAPAGARSVVEVGVGSGCLIATLLVERPTWCGFGVDLDPLALHCTRENARRHALESRLSLWRGDSLGALCPRARFDLLISNPPYVTPSELAACEPEVRTWEPRLALLAPEADPLAAYRPLVARWAASARGTALVCEVGAGRADAVEGLLRAHGPRAIAVRADWGGVPRAVGAVL